MKIIGIDLHSDSFYAGVCKCGPEDKKLLINVTKHYLRGDSFDRFKASLTPEDYILVEASTNAFWFHNQVAGKVHTCYIYNTNQARREGNKTDKIDAKKLAKKLAYFLFTGEEKEQLPLVYVPSVEIQEIRGLFSTYKLHQKAMVQFVNRIHSIAKQNGICLDRKKLRGKKADDHLASTNLPAIWKYQIDLLRRGQKVLEAAQEEVKEQILVKGTKLFKQEIELLLSIKGFSAFTAIALMSDVCEVNRFSSAKKFCSYLRTAPKVKGSNKVTQIGKVNKQSRTLTVSLLTQSVKHFSQAGEHMENFYKRVKQGKSHGKSRIALIRKILVSAYYMLTKKESYYWTEKGKYAEKVSKYEKEIDRINKKMKNVA